MIYNKNIGLFVVAMQFLPIFSAGVMVTTTKVTGAKIIYDNGDFRVIGLFPGDTIRVDAGLAGFREIQWIGTDGGLYSAGLNIPGLNAWRPLKIDGYKVNIGAETGSLFPGAAMGDRNGNKIG